MKRLLSVAWGLVLLSVPVAGADVKKPADQRFADADSKEVPDFQRHVLPLMGRLGCNGRACHGSFQGQGGFRLSLFGYDFKADLDALTSGDNPRVDVESVEDSLMLAKPTLATPHKGGKRIEQNTWEYKVLHKWIQSGAHGVSDDHAEFVRLEVTPRELVFRKPGDTAQIRAVAHWSDGTAEDVTPLCRFRTNDESVAEINADGLVKSLGKGDTHVVAFYDNGVAPTQIILPVSDKTGKNYPKVPVPTKIDQLVVEQLRKLGVVPSDLADDAEFLRRVSLDITGSLPAPEEVLAFVADKSPKKRATKIDELLERPAYAAWWATLLCDLTGNNARQLQQNAFGNQSGQQASEQWYAWIHKRISENTPYDQLIKGIVLAASRTEGQDYDQFVADMGSYFIKSTDERHKNFAERESMPYYWVNNVIRNKPEEMALRFSHTFLGVRLQCAQCHKHPFDQWTQNDFKQFSAFFNRVRYGNNPEAAKRMAEIEKEAGLKDLKNNQDRQRRAQELLNDGKPLPWQELFVAKGSAAPQRGKGNVKQGSGQRTITPKLLGGDEVIDELADPRAAIMDWMLDKENPYFARAIINRIWAHYFGVGIIDPPDDLNLANPPSNAALLDYLAGSFVEHGFDLKWLHREIANSRTYQLTWKTNETNQFDTRNFSHSNVRRLPAEVAYDAIVFATASTDQWQKLNEDPSSRAIADQRSNARQGRGQQQYALRVFGQPERASTCDCERSTEPSLSQSLYLMNDQELFALMDRKDGRLAELGRGSAEAVQAEARQKQKAQADAKNLKAQADRLREIEQRIKRLKDQGKEEEVANLERKVAAFRKQLDEAREKAKGESPQAVQDAARPPLDADEIVRDLYLRTLSRLPSDEEMSRSREYVAASKDTVSGVRDVLWALLNTKEFIVNH